MKNAGNDERNGNEEKIYSKRLKIVIKNSDKEEKSSLLTVSAELRSTPSALFRKDLVVRLTDDENPLFFYHLKLNDDDYQSLRVQQGLLVDFSAFPQQFIDLLEQCRQEEMKSSPRFVLHLILGSANSVAVLNIVEINPFKHLVHLALKLATGTDSEVKDYLASCLKVYKAKNEELHYHLTSTELDMNGRLRECSEHLAKSLSETDQLKRELREQAQSLHERFNQQAINEKDKAAHLQNEMQVRYERERMELNFNHSKSVERLEARCLSLESQMKDLTEKRSTLEATVHELRNRVSVSEDDSRMAHQEIQELRKENSRLESSRGEWERSSGHLNNRVANLEQELKGKDTQLLKLQTQLETVQEHKIRLSEDLELKQSLLTRRENSVKLLADDLNKGNEIIRKLQTDIRNLHSKLKLRNKVTQEQEKVVNNKEKAVETLQGRLNSLEEMLHQKENEAKLLNESLSTAHSKLDENQKILKTNENVINWLNKQLNESQVNQQRTNNVAVAPIPQNTPFRPMGNVGQLFATSTPGSSSSLSNPLLPSRQSVQYNANQAIIQVEGKLPSYGSIPEEPVLHSVTPQASNKENNPPLNAKYFQSKNVGASSMTTRYKSINGARLPRTSIAPIGGKRSSDQTASAYFPS